ncbi:MAG: hypothetical protein MUF07_06645 [Steroidobacteraceae bacterium]|jgi:hypothetical protein|nr:hypothetical protein [Steroidobacteraceae bacterium]
MPKRRDVMFGGTVGAALAGLGLALGADAADAAGATPAQGAPAGGAGGPPAATAGTVGTVSRGGPAASGPWLKRAFQLYNAPDGQSAIRRIDLPGPQDLETQWLLRRPAERVTLGMMSPSFMMDFHVANQPNILIPLFGTLVVRLKDGSEHAFGHGDILFAEDCNGIGHMSGAGPEGCFSVSVQLPKTGHCLDPKQGPTEILSGRGKPKY